MVSFEYAVAKLTIIARLIAYACVEVPECTIRLMWLEINQTSAIKEALLDRPSPEPGSRVPVYLRTLHRLSYLPVYTVIIRLKYKATKSSLARHCRISQSMCIAQTKCGQACSAPGRSLSVGLNFKRTINWQYCKHTRSSFE
jgi:hypothetical protein